MICSGVCLRLAITILFGPAQQWTNQQNHTTWSNPGFVDT